MSKTKSSRTAAAATVTIHGAAGEVTGSAYHLETTQASVLVDFGLFQGRAMAEKVNCVPDALKPANLDAVLLTHAHLDHTGRLPLLARAGYQGPVYGTPATLDLTRLILEDAAKVQEQDTARTNRKLRAKGKPEIEPLFAPEHVAAVVSLLRPLPYERSVQVAPGIHARLFESGHILGSASVELRVQCSGRSAIVVFSGDIGPRDAPILKDAACLTGADWVFMESTYGDRDHRSIPDTVAEFRELIQRAAVEHGKILIPTFAVGRAQVMLYHLAQMFQEKVVPRFPVVLDSPMAIEATRIHKAHPELYDEEMRGAAGSRNFLRHLGAIQNSVTADDSKALNDLEGPCVILAGAGMCNAGRIVHHLRHNLSRPGTVVIIVGFQAGGSLGRALVDGAETVSIFGERIPVRARVHSLGGFSAHAGQRDLTAWYECLARSRPRVVLTHGEDRGRKPLKTLLEKRFNARVQLPALGATYALFD